MITDLDNMTREELLDELENIYQTELATFNNVDFDIDNAKFMDDDELKEFVKKVRW